MFGRSAKTLAAAVSLAIVALVGGSGAQTAAAQTRANEFGSLPAASVTGATDNGAKLAGKYRVTKFVVRNDKVTAVGRLTGTMTKRNGTTQTVAKQVRMPLNLAETRAANVTSALPAPLSTRAPSVVGCEVLNLVLGPLDLNLLGLVVHLDKVVLNITAVPGAGALLGNLLCAVVGLLDGAALGGLTGILTNLLNAILGILRA